MTGRVAFTVAFEQASPDDLDDWADDLAGRPDVSAVELDLRDLGITAAAVISGLLLNVASSALYDVCRRVVERRREQPAQLVIIRPDGAELRLPPDGATDDEKLVEQVLDFVRAGD